MSQGWRSLDDAVGALRDELGITIAKKHVLSACEMKGVKMTKMGTTIYISHTDFIAQFDSIASALKTEFDIGQLNAEIGSSRYQLNCRSTMGAIVVMANTGKKTYTGDEIVQNIATAINKGLREHPRHSYAEMTDVEVKAFLEAFLVNEAKKVDAKKRGGRSKYLGGPAAP